MKKVLLVLAMVLSVGIFSGCSHDQENGQGEGEMAKEQFSSKEQKQEMKSEMEKAMDMIRSGKKLKCVYTVKNEEGEMKMTTYAEGKKYRTQMEFPEGEMNSVFDGENVYSWTKGEKNGMKMNLECQKQLGSEQVATEEIDEQAVEMSEDVEEVFEGAFDISCEPVASIDFSVPSDVSFADQCEMLKKQMEMIKNMQQGQGVPQMNY